MQFIALRSLTLLINSKQLYFKIFQSLGLIGRSYARLLNKLYTIKYIYFDITTVSLYNHL